MTPSNRSPMMVGPVAIGLDPGRRATGTVVLLLKPVLGVVAARRIPNEELYDSYLRGGDIAFVVMEDYRLYPWAAATMRWSPLEEVRTIGAVEEICRHLGIPLVKIQPSSTKQSVTDHMLRQLGTWARNQHITDAFRVWWTAVLFHWEDVIGTIR